MLKSLEISGFKSFAKKTELDFKSRITAIVGPNGSGKSNVAEAFRFALGEQSIKSMRGKRGEDLIWNGTNEVTRANRASVKIVLDNKNQIFTSKDSGIKTDFDEVIIERVVGRDGMNEYLLNGSRVRLKDIFELLSVAHIGSSGHHIISQGEADRLLRATTKERKTIIEDALGLKIYQYKREESEKKLLKTEENIKQVELLRNEIAPHLKFLKKQVEKAEKAEEIKNKLKIFYKDYLNREKTYIEHTKSEILKEKTPILEEIEKLNKEMDNARRILADSKNKDLKSKEILETESKIKSTREKLDLLSREIGKVEGETSINQRLLEKAKQEQELRKDILIPLIEIENLEKEISFFETVSQVLEKIRFFINSHKNNTDNKNLDELIENSKKLLERKKVIEEDIEINRKMLIDLDNIYQDIKKAIEKDVDSSREAEREIFRISTEQNSLHSKIQLISSEEIRIKMLEDEWRREITEAGVLLGTEVLQFDNLETNIEEILKEERIEQEKRRRELEKMKIRLEEIGGASSSETIKEYQDTKERDEYLEKELEDLNKSKELLKKMIEELSLKLEEEFKFGIEKINTSFKEYFALMFDGGEAKLKIENLKPKIGKAEYEENEIFNIENQEEETGSGIEIEISLPRKRIKGLEMLSGGERALTSIALLFAISQVNPPPFIILDETDAALDEANSKKYGDMIENLSEYSQLILITHNRETMSRAGVIYGVTMGKDGVSRLLSIAFDEAVAVAK